VYERPVEDWVHPHAGEDVDNEPAPQSLNDAVVAVLGSPNIASSRWVWQQYDSIVGSGTFQGPGSDAAVIRLPDADKQGIALATDGNGRWCALDPTEGARLVVAEAARNVACTGARPVAATNCLNFGSPERPEIMGQFRDTIAGMTEACRALGTPVTGGNVSFYNQTGSTAVHPTPVIGMLGIVDDVTATAAAAFVEAGDEVFLVGDATRPGLGGSEYLWRWHGTVAGRPPAVDLAAEARLHRLLVAAVGNGLLRSAHDVSTGGMLATIVEACLGRGLGVSVRPEPDVEAHQWLFSESPTRVVVSTRDPRGLRRRCAEHQVGCQRLGAVTADGTVTVEGVLTMALDQLRLLHERALPNLLGELGR
jgi:phosphoribosylformylglycinamidine synthase